MSWRVNLTAGTRPVYVRWLRILRTSLTKTGGPDWKASSESNHAPETTKTGAVHNETRYYLSSLEADAQYINHSIRTHWSVENQLYWTLDVAFGDDALRKQKDNAAQNFSLLNRIGLNIIKNEKVSSMGVKGHRKKAGWDNDYLLYALKSFDVVKI